MNRLLPTFCAVFAVVFMLSCQAQNNRELPIKQQDKRQLSTSKTDHDPYFTESSTIHSISGPNSITRNILQDKNGYFWFASWEGIMGYDGKSFTNYTNKEGLRRFHVFCILEDKTGMIWFGTIGAGVYRYDPKAAKAERKSFTNFTTKDGLANDRVTCMYEDRKGNIWIGTTDGLSCYEPAAQTTGKIQFRNFSTEDGLCNTDVNSIVEDQAGNLWFGTRGETCIYNLYAEDKEEKSFRLFTNKDGSAFTNVRSIIEDQRGNIWLGGNNGLWSYDGKSFTNHNTQFVGYIFEDRKGDIWTGSVKDATHDWVLSRYEWSNGIATRNIVKDQRGQVFGIIEDQAGQIWYGHERGICSYDPTTDPAKEDSFFCYDFGRVGGQR